MFVNSKVANIFKRALGLSGKSYIKIRNTSLYNSGQTTLDKILMSKPLIDIVSGNNKYFTVLSNRVYNHFNNSGESYSSIYKLTDYCIIESLLLYGLPDYDYSKDTSSVQLVYKAIIDLYIFGWLALKSDNEISKHINLIEYELEFILSCKIEPDYVNNYKNIQSAVVVCDSDQITINVFSNSGIKTIPISNIFSERNMKIFKTVSTTWETSFGAEII